VVFEKIKVLLKKTGKWRSQVGLDGVKKNLKKMG